MIKPSYNKEGCKGLSFATFRKMHENIEYFLYLSDEQWEDEYFEATGKKVTKKLNTEKGE